MDLCSLETGLSEDSGELSLRGGPVYYQNSGELGLNLGPTILIVMFQFSQFETNHLKLSYICFTSPWNSLALKTLVEFNIDNQFFPFSSGI